MSNTAWMLRQDGLSVPCKVHLYSMHDEDLSSEAEVSSFLIHTKSEDLSICYQALDAWMAMLIQDDIPYDADDNKICELIKEKIQSLPYHLAFMLPVDEYITIHQNQENYSDVDELYEFLDQIQEQPAFDNLQSAVRQSLNQQFCRVRFGGKYDTENGNSEIWFRISSVGYNWSNTIYQFVSDMKRSLGIEYITVCRDYESDNGEIEGQAEYFYTAKDGRVYHHMPIDEFMSGEHEANPVFASEANAGILHGVRASLHNGKTFEQIKASLEHTVGSGWEEIFANYILYIYRSEVSKCVTAATTFDDAPTRTKMKLSRFTKMILAAYPEISSVKLSYDPRENRNGNPVGFEMYVEIESPEELIDHMEISLVSTKSLAQTADRMLFRQFRQEYEDYKRFNHLNF